MRLNGRNQFPRAFRRDAQPKIAFITIQSALNTERLPQKMSQPFLFGNGELLSIEITRRAAPTAVIHEPHRQGERVQLNVGRNALLSLFIEPTIIAREDGNTACGKPIRNTRTVAQTALGRCEYERLKYLIFPVHVLFAVPSVVHFQKGVRSSLALLAQCAIAKQAADQDSVLYWLKTSHGIADWSILSGIHKTTPPTTGPPL